MSDDTTDRPRVLVVDDQPDLADLYARWLSDEYDVETAYSGGAALKAVDDDVDVVLLDRRMPGGPSGDEVLERIRERNYDVRVAMVTAVDPDFDIVDIQVDDYIVKSVTEPELKETVELLLKLDEYDRKRYMLTSKKIRRNVLEIEKEPEELARSPEFERLEAEIDDLEAEIGDIDRDLSEAGFDVSGSRRV